MRYLAALDYEHLDNGMFLASFAKSLSQQEDVQPVIVHGDSAYTERVIQTGVMREDAKVRSIKDLNHRLIALFADEGVSAIGINGYQREFITIDNGNLHVDRSYYDSLPKQPILLISTLVQNKQTGKPQPVSLADLCAFLKETLQIDELFIFSSSDSDEIITDQDLPSEASREELDKTFLQEKIPAEFRTFAHPIRLTTAQHFHKIPSLTSTMLLS